MKEGGKDTEKKHSSVSGSAAVLSHGGSECRGTVFREGGSATVLSHVGRSATVLFQGGKSVAFSISGCHVTVSGESSAAVLSQGEEVPLFCLRGGGSAA